MTLAGYRSQMGYASLEGYIAARILITALQQCGAEPTRARLSQELRTLQGTSFQGYPIPGSSSSKNSAVGISEITFLNGQSGSFLH